ncbi:Zinc finger, FYVE-related [Phytophthora cactorum]|nr:Zinc finger, FYVE-related [Phytophthora cactorum]
MRESRNNVLVPVPAPSGKLSVVDCDYEALDLGELRHSIVSETESEGGHISFFSEREAAKELDRCSRSLRSRQVSAKCLSCRSSIPRMTASELIEEEVTEVMTRRIWCRYRRSTLQSEAGLYDNGKASSGAAPIGSARFQDVTAVSGPVPCRTGGAARRMMLSASGMRHQNSAKPGSGTLGSSGCGTSGGVQSTRSRPDIPSWQAPIPSPDDYFPPVSLSLTQVQQYQAQVEELAVKAMQSCRDHENRVAGRKTLAGRCARLGSVDCPPQTGSSYYHAHVRDGHGRLPPLCGLLLVRDVEQLFAWNQFFFGCALDAVVLCNLDLGKSDKQATLGIKWTCMQPSVLTRKRDECFLEYVLFRKDDQGRDAAVIVRMPVDIPECPPLPHELKTKREKITTVMVVRESDAYPNATQVFMLSKCEHKGLTASTKYCKKLLRALKDVSLSADAKRIATTISAPGFMEQSRVGGEPFAGGNTIRPWVPSSVQQGCTSCTRPFRAGHRRRHCQMCGDVFCSKCLVQRAGIRQDKNAFSNYITMSNQRTFRVVQSLFCKVCVTRSREDDAETIQEQIEATRRSVASSKSSSVPRRSSMGSSTQPQSSKCSTPTSSVPRSSHSQQTDAPRRSATWNEENRASWWSENESDTCSWKSGSSRFSTISRNCSGAPTVRSSFNSEYSLGRNSFLAVQSLQTPREIDDDRIDDRIDERSSIYEVIDTKDMVPESELQKQLRSQQSSASESTDSADDDYFSEFSDTVRSRYTSTPVAPTFLPPHSTTARRTRSTDQNENAASSKSLDQCIAEQNELLQQVLSASRGFAPETQPRAEAPSVSQSIHEDDEDHDDGVYELSDMFTARSSKVNTFPLPDDYFPDVQLSTLEVLELEEKMALAVKNALADYDVHEAMGSNPIYGAGWKTLGKVADLTTVRQNGDAALCQCRIFGRLGGDYRNFINFFYAETSNQLYAWNQFMYGNAVDAAILKNIHTSASGKPHLYLGIKWTCLQPFALVKKRDTCFLEYMAFTKDLRAVTLVSG